MDQKTWLDRMAAINPVDGAPVTPPRRRFGRVAQAALHCNLGEVVDICANGMRIRSKRKLRRKKTLDVQFLCYELPGTLNANIVWTKRLSFFSYEIGLKFQDTTPEVRQKLTAIAGCGGVRRFKPDPFADIA